MSVLEATDKVKTVRAKLRMFPSHRMMAPLTPSSLALSRTASTICDTAYRPHTDGPNTVRASHTPTRKLQTRTTTVLSALHLAPAATLLPSPRSAVGCSARGSGGETGYMRGPRVTARAGPRTSATRPGLRAEPAAA